jgi:hypothetical protein
VNASDKAIADILKRYGEDFTSNTWVVPGGKARAIQHKCIERMAVEAGITFAPPVMVRSDVDMCVMIVTGHMQVKDGEIRSEWSVGEAAPKNNKNAYPYSMAEKRGKDRVALKLIGLHGLLYSEEEADDFRQRSEPAPAPAPDLRNVHDIHTNGKPIQRNASQETAGRMLTKLWTISGNAVVAWLQRDDVKRAIDTLDEVDRHRVEDLAEERSVIQGEEAVAQ